MERLRVGAAWVLIVLAQASAAAAQESLADDVKALRNEVRQLRAEVTEKERREASLRTEVESLKTKLEREAALGIERERRISDLVREASYGTSPLEDAIDQAAQESVRRWYGIRPRGNVRFGGYFDLEYRNDDAKDVHTFDQHRLILQFEADVAKQISFRSEIEFEGGGIADFLEDAEIVLEYAELHYEVDEAINVKAGALLIPFLRFNQHHDSPLYDLTDRPLVDRRIVPTTWAEAGIGVFGTFFAGDWAFNYDVVLVNGLTEEGIDSHTGTRDAKGAYRVDNNDNKMVVGRVGVLPVLPFLDAADIGGSFGIGQYDDDDRRQILMYGVDWLFRIGPVELLGEYARIDLEREAPEKAMGLPESLDGLFAQVNFHFFPDSWRGATPFFTEESTFTLVFRFDTADLDTSVTGADFMDSGAGYRDDRRRYTIGFNFRPVERSVFKIEYQFIDEPDGIEDVDNDRFVVSFATYF
jgi:hypothetical protein